MLRKKTPGQRINQFKAFWNMKTVYDSDVSIDDMTISDSLTNVTFTELFDDFEYTREIVDVEQAEWVPYEEIARPLRSAVAVFLESNTQHR